VYPFNNKPLQNSWVGSFIDELGVEVEVVHPNEVEEKVRNFLASLNDYLILKSDTST